METVDLQQLGQDTARIIAAAQHGDVLVVDSGRVVAVVTKPPAPRNFAAYWREREKRLSEITIDPSWDSTQAVSDDRER